MKEIKIESFSHFIRTIEKNVRQTISCTEVKTLIGHYDLKWGV